MASEHNFRTHQHGDANASGLIVEQASGPATRAGGSAARRFGTCTNQKGDDASLIRQLSSVSERRAMAPQSNPKEMRR